MRKSIRLLWKCSTAAAGAEFALVLPLMLLLLMGTIDVGRFMWEVNRAEKATQAGARYAVVTSPVSTGLINADFVGGDIKAGDLMPADMLGKLVCTRSTCTCTACAVSVGSSVDTAKFDAIVSRMQTMDPEIGADNVSITYRGSGFGFAGDQPGAAAETMEISPLVTVTLSDMSFDPMILLGLGNLTLPSFSTTLPAEDASGAVSN